MSVSFTTAPGTVYYIMVDGGNGNTESFGIIANSSAANIVGRPNANFNTSPTFGCAPLSVMLENTTVLQGGTNISYEWQIDNGAYLPASGADTSVLLTTPGNHTLALRVCNSECGCKRVSQDVLVQQLVGSFSYTSAGPCAGNAFNFLGQAEVLPNPPYSDPGVTDWLWNFGDPASGADSIASGQSVSHVFSGTQPTYDVSLTIVGACSTVVVTQQVQADQLPVIVVPDSVATCMGSPVPLSVVATGTNVPFTYLWNGSGPIACDTCATTVADPPATAGSHTYTVTVTDSQGCSVTDSTTVTVFSLPEASVTPSFLVCRGDSVRLTSSVITGTAPFTYAWSPATGLDDPSSSSPGLIAWSTGNYCLTLTDSSGCSSDPVCSAVTLHTSPTLSPANSFVCVTAPNPQTTLTVTGAGPGSVYSWIQSPDYALITGANTDSSEITVTFPAGAAAGYSFVVTVTDGVTGCRDTLQSVITAINNVNLSVSGPTDACEGDIVNLTVSGADNYVWSSSPSFTFTDSTATTQTVPAETNLTFTVLGTAGSCTQTITFDLTVHPKPVVDITPIPGFCDCDSLLLDASVSIPNGILLWNGTVPVLDPTVSSTSAYACANASFSLTVTDPATGCSSSDSTAVIAHASPAATASVTPEQICSGTPGNILLNGFGSDSDSGTAYSWTAVQSGVNIINPGSLLSSAVISDFTVFRLTVTDSFGCDSSAYDTVNVFPAPVLSISNPFICSSDTASSVTAMVSGAAEGSFFTWITDSSCVFQTGASDSTASFEFGTCGPGNYEILVRVIDAITGCSNDLSVTVRVIDSVSITVSSPVTVCEGSDIYLTAGGANSYIWSTGDTTSSVVVFGPTVANSPYTFTVTGIAGLCSNSATTTVSVVPQPSVPVIDGPDTVCQNSSSAFYSVTPSAGSFLWTVVGGTIVNGQGTGTIEVDWGLFGLGQVSVRDTSANVCNTTGGVLDIFIAPRPVPATNINGPYRVCAGSTITYLVLPVSGSSYTWSVAGGNVNGGLAGDSILVSWPDTGSGLVTVFETNSYGCSGPVTWLPITIHEVPAAPVITGDWDFCQGSTALYTTQAAAGSHFNWQTNGGMISGVNIQYDSINVTWTIPGRHALSVSETNRWGCTGPLTTDSVTVHQRPDVIITDDSMAACQNSSLLLSASSSYGSISWSTNGNGIFDNASSISPGYVPGTADTGVVTITVTSSAPGCPDDSDSIVVTMNPLPEVQVSASADTVCEGIADTLTASGGNAFLWYPSGDTTSAVVVLPSVTTVYTVVATGAAGCTATGTVTVYVDPAGIADAGSDLSACEGDTVELLGSGTNGTGVIWQTDGDGTFYPDSLSEITGYVPGSGDILNGTVALYISTTGACRNDRDSMTITLGTLPTAYAGPDTSVVTVDVIGITIPLTTAAADGSNITWTSTGTGTFVPDANTVNATYLPSRQDIESDSVVLTLSVNGGCMNASDQMIIRFIPFIIPNVITPYPGSPGKNDYFEIRHLPENSSMKIWDRWGILVFESTDYRNNWDAANLNSDTYYYLLGVNGKDFRGWLRVIRDER
jgi:hypothetical protein